MRGVIRRVVPICLAAAALVPGGCVVAALAVGAAATYGAVKYTDNEAYRDFHASFEPTWAATLGALRDEGYVLDESVPHGTSEGRLLVGDALVVVERHPEGFTRVRVRIGTFETDDHRRRATLVLDRVATRVE